MTLAAILADTLDRSPHVRIFEATRPELDHWQQMAERNEQRVKRAERGAFVLACVALGLLFGLMYAGIHRAPPPTCPGPPTRSEMTDDTAIRSFDPFTVNRTITI